MVNSYRDLRVWQEAIRLVKLSYQLTKQFPTHETYGLKQQLQRAAVSVPANIPEGNGRSHTREYLRHLSIAHGSLMELETHIVEAQELEYLSPEASEQVLSHSSVVGKLLNALRRSLRLRLDRQQSGRRLPGSPCTDP